MLVVVVAVVVVVVVVLGEEVLVVVVRSFVRLGRNGPVRKVGEVIEKVTDGSQGGPEKYRGMHITSHVVVCVGAWWCVCRERSRGVDCFVCCDEGR